MTDTGINPDCPTCGTAVVEATPDYVIEVLPGPGGFDYRRPVGRPIGWELAPCGHALVEQDPVEAYTDARMANLRRESGELRMVPSTTNRVAQRMFGSSAEDTV